MKILQVIYESDGNPFGMGGAGVRAYEIYARLRERHEVTFLCMKYPGARDGEYHGLRHVFVGTESRSLAASVLAYTIKAAYFLKRHGDDFDVIVENFLPSTPFFSKFLTQAPVLLQIQGMWGSHYTRKFGFFFGLPMCMVEKIYPRLYKKFILVTDVNMASLIQKAQRCYVIPNGIDVSFIESKEPEGDYILFLSRIDVYHKGLDILVDAFGRIAAGFDKLKLVLAGYQFDSAEDLKRRLPADLRERVTYAGFVSGEGKRRLISGAKIFVLPSRIEAHPICILEAMACGRAVIVSDIPEMRFVGDKHLGLTFSSGSVKGLAEKLETMLQDKDLRKRLGDRGRGFARGNLWDSVAVQFENALELAANEKK
ncbi:MAG: glycosyltransferase family 4 protein [Nitrospiraceae bacterium]|nr:glycosyltransferase family 4 protein [Nitrospiraceae bacterium]